MRSPYGWRPTSHLGERVTEARNPRGRTLREHPHADGTVRDRPSAGSTIPSQVLWASPSKAPWPTASTKRRTIRTILLDFTLAGAQFSERRSRGSS